MQKARTTQMAKACKGGSFHQFPLSSNSSNVRRTTGLKHMCASVYWTCAYTQCPFWKSPFLATPRCSNPQPLWKAGPNGPHDGSTHPNSVMVRVAKCLGHSPSVPKALQNCLGTTNLYQPLYLNNMESSFHSNMSTPSHS